jgi:hypothetical protein
MWNVNKLIDRAGDWNAQLFRELKGRATTRNMLLAVGLSIGAQLLLLLTFLIQLPSNPHPGAIRSYQNYCVLESMPVGSANGNPYNEQICQLNTFGQVITDWPRWWADILIPMSWLLPLLLLTGGVYLLASDLRKETRQGTLNFLRLSPQSAAEIWLGKLLGVPVIIYVAIAVALPLHMVAAVGSRFGVVNLAIWYLLIAAIAGVFYIATLLVTIATPMMPIVITGMSLLLSHAVLSLTNSLVALDLPANSWPDSLPQLSWFYLPIAQNLFSLYLFGVGNCLVAIYWLWRSINRRYLDPNCTLLTKKSSYQLNFCWQTWLVGFGLPLFTSIRSSESSSTTVFGSFLGCVLLAHIGAGLVAIVALTPPRQTIQDWSRYRRISARQKFGKGNVWRDLLWDDRSPALLTIAVNLLIALVIWLPWYLLTIGWESVYVSAVVLILFIALLNCGTLTQLGMIYSNKWSWPVMMISTAFLFSIPIISVGLLLLSGLNSPALLIGVGGIMQSFMLVVTIATLQRQIRRVGQSETQALFSAT